MNAHTSPEQACKYLYTVDLGYRKETRVNAALFAQDLAKELGGTYRAKVVDSIEPDRSGEFVVDGARISVYSNGYQYAGKAHLYIDADVDWHKVGSMPYVSSYRPEMRAPDIMVSVNRPLKTLAKDIKRRLIEAGAEAVKLRREYYDQQVTRQSGAQIVAGELQDKFGSIMSVRLPDERAEGGTFHLNGNGTYCSGRFSADGSMTIDHIGSLNAEQFAALAKILRPEV